MHVSALRKAECHLTSGTDSAAVHGLVLALSAAFVPRRRAQLFRPHRLFSSAPFLRRLRSQGVDMTSALGHTLLDFRVRKTRSGPQARERLLCSSSRRRRCHASGSRPKRSKSVDAAHAAIPATPGGRLGDQAPAPPPYNIVTTRQTAYRQIGEELVQRQLRRKRRR